MLSLRTKYDFLRCDLAGGSFGGGLRHSSKGRFVADPNFVAEMPGYTTVDLLAQYRLKFAGRDATLQINARNVLNKEYREGNMGGFGRPAELHGLAQHEVLKRTPKPA